MCVCEVCTWSGTGTKLCMFEEIFGDEVLNVFAVVQAAGRRVDLASLSPGRDDGRDCSLVSVHEPEDERFQIEQRRQTVDVEKGTPGCGCVWGALW